MQNHSKSTFIPKTLKQKQFSGTVFYFLFVIDNQCLGLIHQTKVTEREVKSGHFSEVKITKTWKESGINLFYKIMELKMLEVIYQSRRT